MHPGDIVRRSHRTGGLQTGLAQVVRSEAVCVRTADKRRKPHTRARAVSNGPNEGSTSR